MQIEFVQYNKNILTLIVFFTVLIMNLKCEECDVRKKTARINSHLSSIRNNNSVFWSVLGVSSKEIQTILD